jgi:hypothetical protein
MFLALALVATLGLAAGPNSALGMATGSEAFSVLVTGGFLLLLAAAARRTRAVNSKSAVLSNRG